MFDSVFTEHVLERIGGNSVTLVLNSEGICEFASSATATVLGIAAEELKGKNFVETVTLFSLDGVPITESGRIVTKALEDKDFVQSTPFFCKLDSVTSDSILALTTISVTDESDQRYVILQIRKTQREVDVGEMKSLFVSFAAHQLKTPSSVVKGFLELMMRQGEAAYSEEQWHFLTSAFESNEQLISVSKSLLNMARLEGGLIEPNIQEFDPNRALQSKIASFGPLYKTKRVTVNVSTSAGDASNFRSDESFFLEVFGILLGNAIKHSSIGGNINVSLAQDSNQCEVHVIDEGPGIPQAVKEVLFKSEQEFSEKENSHGLGLYMAKKYLALLGGTVGLEDSETGSDFYFTIPNASLK